jgi:hypothetical protein
MQTTHRPTHTPNAHVRVSLLQSALQAAPSIRESSVRVDLRAVREPPVHRQATGREAVLALQKFKHAAREAEAARARVRLLRARAARAAAAAHRVARRALHLTCPLLAWPRFGTLELRDGKEPFLAILQGTPTPLSTT